MVSAAKASGLTSAMDGGGGDDDGGDRELSFIEKLDDFGKKLTEQVDVIEGNMQAFVL